jgi:hypothetical protein
MQRSLTDKFSLVFFLAVLLTIAYMLFAFATGRFEQHKSWVYSVDRNSQNSIISASQNEILVWNGRRCTDRLVGHAGAIKSVSFSQNGQLFASGAIDNNIKVWSLQTKKVIQTLHGHTAGVNRVAFDTSGNYIVSAGYDNKLMIWDWRKNKKLKVFDSKHSGFSINSANVLAYVDSGCRLNFFHLTSLNRIKSIGETCGVPVYVPHKNRIATNETNTSLFTFIDTNNSGAASSLRIKKENDAREVSVFTFTTDGNYLLAGIWGGDIEIWDWQKKKLVRTLQDATLSSINDLRIVDENSLLSASGDRSVKVWDWQSGNLKMIIGNGLFQQKLNGVLALLLLLTLLSGFWGISRSPQSSFSSLAIISILSVWSMGLLLLLYFLKPYLVRFSVAISWIVTILSGLFFISIYFSWLSIVTIPVVLFFSYIQIISNRQKTEIYIPLVINLVFCGILCSSALETGLFR